MNFLRVSCAFLFCFAVLCSGNKHSIQKRKATAFLNAVTSIGLSVVSLTLDIYSLVKDNEDTEAMLAKWDEILSKLNKISENVEETNLLLQTVLQELSKTVYANAIIDAEREIDHCFDVLREFTRNSSSTQSINNMKKCYSAIIYVKQIGKIVTGQTLGISSKSLFDILIEQHKHCNGTEILGIQNYLSQLLMKGCSAVIFAETLEYKETSSQYKDYCTTAFGETDSFRQTLFKFCASESCNIVQGYISNTLNIAHSSDHAFYLLSKEFPWFYFTVVETQCSTECHQDKFFRFGNAKYNLQTYRGKNRMFLVSYRDERYKSSGSGNPTGFEVPQTCRVSLKNDLGYRLEDVAGSSKITFVMHDDNEVQIHSKICRNQNFDCKKQITTQPPKQPASGGMNVFSARLSLNSFLFTFLGMYFSRE